MFFCCFVCVCVCVFVCGGRFLLLLNSKVGHCTFLVWWGSTFCGRRGVFLNKGANTSLWIISSCHTVWKIFDMSTKTGINSKLLWKLECISCVTANNWLRQESPGSFARLIYWYQVVLWKIGKHAGLNKTFNNFAAYWQKADRVIFFKALYVILFMDWNKVEFFLF